MYDGTKEAGAKPRLMRGGHVDAISRKFVAGWAADPEQPGHRLALTVTIDGVFAGETVAERLRPDLARLGRFGDGRHGFNFTFTEPLDPTQDHVVLVRYASDGVLLPNGEQRIPRGAQHDEAAATAGRRRAIAGDMTPILVTAPGRSGTTLLMSLLARSPQIVAAELVPYELRLLSYYAALYNVLTAGADLERSTHPDRLEGDGFHIGFNPFNSPQYNVAFRNQAVARDFWENQAPSRLQAFVREVVEEYYARLAQDRGKGRVRYFAEKGNNLHKPTRLFTRETFGPVRELVIVRDPRDVLCSHVAYFSSSEEKAFSQLTHSCRQLMAIKAEGRSDVHVLRYEDMVRGEPSCFEALSQFLGTPIEPENTPKGAEVFRKHGTSESPEASIDRWRTNLPPSMQERCANEWHDFFTAFGLPRE